MGRSQRQARKRESGFSLIELVVVIAILGVLIGIATLAAKPLLLDARQMAAASHVEAVLKSANVYWHTTGDLPSTWDQIRKFAGETGPLGGNALESCVRFGTRCNGNERVIVNGNYLISFYVEPGRFSVSAWRFTNIGKTAENRSVVGCLSENNGQKIYAWKEQRYYQGPAWSGQEDDEGNILRLC
jgi:prepilin-type N-terminal cleavage/methylation domain-containing protein